MSRKLLLIAIFVCLLWGAVIWLIPSKGPAPLAVQSERPSSSPAPLPVVDSEAPQVPPSHPVRRPQPPAHKGGAAKPQIPAAPEEQGWGPPPPPPPLKGPRLAHKPLHETRRAWPSQKLEARLHGKLGPRDLDDTLRKVRVGDLGPYLPTAVPLVPLLPGSGTVQAPPPSAAPSAAHESDLFNLNLLLGKFEGEAHFDDGKKVWEVRLQLTGTIEGEKLHGDCSVEILDGSQVITKATQSGDLTLIKRQSRESAALLISPSDDYSLQLYYLKDGDRLAGNLYVRNGDKLEPRAVVRMIRGAPAPGHQRRR